MPGIGTICNMLGILLGGLIGLAGKKFIPERLQKTLLEATGLCVLFIGFSGAMEKMLHVLDGELATQGTMVLLISFTLGTLLGEGLNIEARLEAFGRWLRRKSGCEDDSSFLNGFITASFTVCIGAMAVVGSIQDGMLGDPSTLLLKAALDFLIILVMAASLGKGCLFSAIPVGLWQGLMTLLASLLSPLMTELALDYISLTGSVLIFCVGANLLRSRQLRVANMLPTVFIAAFLGLMGI